MAQIPSMWRSELWHPLSAHFPVALLTVGTLLYLAGSFLRGRERFSFLLPSSRLLLWIGVITAWIAIYTGDEAHSVVTRTLCDPTVLKQHEIYAYWTAWFFTIGVGGESLATYLSLTQRIKKALVILSGILFIGGSAFLTYTSHLGSSLVYQQGAAVYEPTKGCKEFE